jgi:4-amino-4-deoxy-L-arabinose transferase-like glycosyltransferase
MRLALTRWQGALLLGAITFTLVMFNQRDVGIARDETVYFHAGDQYVAWWSDLFHARGALAQQSIEAHWAGTDNNSEHPPLMKEMFGVSEAILHGWFGVDPVSAYRAPTALLHALLVALVFAWAASIWGAWEGAIAALLLLFMPRLFFHAGLACFDAPMVAVWFATVAAYHRALTSRRWAIAAGVAFGLALATKHNALLLPPALVVHAIVVAWPRMRDDWWLVMRAGRRNVVLRAVAATFTALVRRWRDPEVLALVAMAVIGPLVLFALWPWLWFSPIAHVTGWLKFHLNHVHYNFEYLGQNWNHPPFPWHVALVTTLFTVPVVTLAAAALGARLLVTRWWRGRRVPDARRDPTMPALLVFLSAAVAMGPFLLGTTPIFGAEKHWAPAMPSFAIAAGVGVAWAGRQLAALFAERRAAACMAAVAIAVCGAAAVETFHAQPYALSGYNALAGGAPGGADLGMNRQFWGVAIRGVLPFLAAHAPADQQPHLRVYTHDASPAWGWYKTLGLVPPTIDDSGHEDAGVNSSEMAVVIHERHFDRHDYMIWNAYGTVQPVYVLRVDGVPIVSVYARPHPSGAPTHR